jgi:hypothetical protein
MEVTMRKAYLTQPAFKTEIIDTVVRVASGALTVGLLIVIPCLKILGLG